MVLVVVVQTVFDISTAIYGISWMIMLDQTRNHHDYQTNCFVWGRYVIILCIGKVVMNFLTMVIAHKAKDEIEERRNNLIIQT